MTSTADVEAALEAVDDDEGRRATPLDDLLEPGAQHRPHAVILGVDIGSLSFPAQFVVSTACVAAVYVPYGFLQEGIFRTPGFSFAYFLTFMTFLFEAGFGHAHAAYLGHAGQQRAPAWRYALMGALLIGNVGFANAGALLLSYPTKTLFKCSKVLPTMVLGIACFGKHYTASQYFATVLMIAGLFIFTVGEVHVAPNFNLRGVACMSMSLLCEALGTNLQEDTMAKCGSSELELLRLNTFVAAGAALVAMVLSGEIWPAAEFVSLELVLRIAVLATLAYMGGMLLLQITRSSGAFISVTASTIRKFLTVTLSFVFYPKPFLLVHAVGVILTFTGIFLNIVIKSRQQGGAAGGAPPASLSLSSSSSSASAASISPDSAAAAPTANDNTSAMTMTAAAGHANGAAVNGNTVVVVDDKKLVALSSRQTHR